MDDKMGKNLVGVQEIANVLSVPVSWVYQQTSLGQEAIPYYKIGKYVRFDIDEVLRHMRNKQNNHG